MTCLPVFAQIVSMAKVKVNSNKSVAYIKIDELDRNDCESGLCDASDKELVSHFKNEEFIDKWSDNGDDDNGNIMMTCILMWFVCCLLLIVAFNTSQFNEFHSQRFLIMFSPIIFLPIIPISFLICKARKRRFILN